MNERGQYGTRVGQTNSQPPPAEPLNLPKGAAQGPIEDIREAAAQIAAQLSALPQTRGVIVLMTAPGRGWLSQSFDSVKAADMAMTWDQAGDLRREGKITYVAYFEKGGGRLFDWDWWRDSGQIQEPLQWRKTPSQSQRSWFFEHPWMTFFLASAAISGVVKILSGSNEPTASLVIDASEPRSDERKQSLVCVLHSEGAYAEILRWKDGLGLAEGVLRTV
jgi:hypothetical protein